MHLLFRGLATFLLDLSNSLVIKRLGLTPAVEFQPDGITWEWVGDRAPALLSVSALRPPSCFGNVCSAQCVSWILPLTRGCKCSAKCLAPGLFRSTYPSFCATMTHCSHTARRRGARAKWHSHILAFIFFGGCRDAVDKEAVQNFLTGLQVPLPRTHTPPQKSFS